MARRRRAAVSGKLAVFRERGRSRTRRPPSRRRRRPRRRGGGTPPAIRRSRRPRAPSARSRWPAARRARESGRRQNAPRAGPARYSIAVAPVGDERAEPPGVRRGREARARRRTPEAAGISLVQNKNPRALPGRGFQFCCSGPPRPNESGRASVALAADSGTPGTLERAKRRVHEGRNIMPVARECQARPVIEAFLPASAGGAVLEDDPRAGELGADAVGLREVAALAGGVAGFDAAPRSPPGGPPARQAGRRAPCRPRRIDSSADRRSVGVERALVERRR